MGWFGPQSGDCSCCGGGGTCVILEDDFNRANSTDIGSDWTEEAQNWQISSNVLYCPAQNGVAMTVAERASSGVNYVVSGLVTSNGRLIFDADDSAGTYHYIEYRYNSTDARIVLGDNSGVISNQTIGNPSDYQTTPIGGILLKVCVSGSEVLVNYGNLSAGALPFTITPKNGLKAGVGTGTYSTAGWCDGFAYKVRSDSCDECVGGCATDCCSDPPSLEYSVNIPDLGLSGASCGCDGTFEGGGVTLSFLQNCVWDYIEYDESDCGTIPAVGECYFYVRLSLSGCTWTLRIDIGKFVTDGGASCGRIGSVKGQGIYTYTQSDPSDCGAFEYTLNLDGGSSYTDPDCSHTWPSSVTLSPL